MNIKEQMRVVTLREARRKKMGEWVIAAVILLLLILGAGSQLSTWNPLAGRAIGAQTIDGHLIVYRARWGKVVATRAD